MFVWKLQDTCKININGSRGHNEDGNMTTMLFFFIKKGNKNTIPSKRFQKQIENRRNKGKLIPLITTNIHDCSLSCLSTVTVSNITTRESYLSVRGWTTYLIDQHLSNAQCLSLSWTRDHFSTIMPYFYFWILPA